MRSIRSGTLWAYRSVSSTAYHDIITTGKSLGNGFPISATIASDKVAQCIAKTDCGSTLVAGPSVAASHTTLFSRFSEQELQKEVQRKGKIIWESLELLQNEFPDRVTAVTGQGLLLGFGLKDGDPSTLIEQARNMGLLIAGCDPSKNIRIIRL